jgi:hypothetical protein
MPTIRPSAQSIDDRLLVVRLTSASTIPNWRNRLSRRPTVPGEREPV